MACELVKLAPALDRPVMYGALALPTISPWAWFSSMTTRMWSGRGTPPAAGPKLEPRPTTDRAVVQLVAIAFRAAESVTWPLQTAVFSLFSTESLVYEFFEPECGSGHRFFGSRGAPPSSRGTR